MKSVLLFCCVLLYAANSQAQPYLDYVMDDNSRYYAYANTNTGYGLAISDEWMFVGIPGFDKPAQGGYPAYADAGAVEVFRRDSSDGSWDYFQRIIPTVNGDYGYFGRSIDVSGTKVIIGAPGWNNSQGYAMVYQFNGSSWVSSNLIYRFFGSADDQYGYSVAIQGNCVAVGAPGTNGVTNGYSDTNLGKVYNYKLIGSTITELAAKAPQSPAVGNYAGPKYGFSVDVVDRYWDTPATCSTVVGAPYAYNSDPNNPGYTKTTGMIEIYKVNYSSTPYTVSMLLNQLGNSSDNNSQLGYSVSMIENPNANLSNVDYVFAGAPGYYFSTPGENRGKLHCFTTNGVQSNWGYSGSWPRGTCQGPNYRPCISIPSTGNIGDRFGESISMSGQFAVISSPSASGYGKIKIYGKMDSLEFDSCSAGYDLHARIYRELETIDSPNLQSNEKFGFKAATWYYNDVSYVENGDPFYGTVSAPFWDAPSPWSVSNLGISYFIDGEVDGM